MAYSTNTTILSLYPGLPQTTTVGQAYSQTISIINSHITRADNIINGKLSIRYAVPFTTVPPLIQTISEDITSYFVYRSFFTQDNQNKSDYLVELLEHAKETLDEIRDGKIDLIYTTGVIVDERSSTTSEILDSTTKNKQTFFDIDTSTSWKFNQDLLDDVAGKR